MLKVVFFIVGILIWGAMPVSDCAGQDLEELGLANMLNLPLVEDLECTDEQKLKLEKIKANFSKKVSVEFAAINEALRSNPKFDVREASSEILKKLSKQRQERIWEILLPHQQRLIIRQTFWTFVNESTGFQAELSKKYYAEQLKLTRKQKVELKLEGEKLQKEFQDDLANLRGKYRRKMEKEVLSKEQSETLQKLMGDRPLKNGSVKFIKF